MKKTMTKIFALVLVLAMVIGFVAMIPTQAAAIEETPNVEIVANNVIFEEKLHMMYAIKEESISAYENVVIELFNEKDESLGSAVRDGRADIDPSEENEVWCAVFTAQQGIAVQDIAENVYAKVVADGNVVAEGRRSVLEYLYSRLLTNNINENQKAMYESLLVYAGALQTLLTTQTNPVECKDINNYSFVKVEKGTIDGTYAAGMLDKTDANALVKLQANFLPAEGKEIKWNVTVYSDTNAIGTKYTNLTAAEAAAYLAAGNHLILEAVEIGEDTPVIETAEATITFDDLSKNTAFDQKSHATWEENGIVVTNNKGSYTNNLAQYANPARFYKGTTLTVAHSNMTQIVFNCNSNEYANDLQTSIPGSTVNGKVVTVVLNEATQEVTYTMGNQIRVDSIVVTFQVCEEHVEKTVDKAATCTEDGYTGRVICEVCGEVIEEGTVVTAAGHSYEEKVTAPTCTAKGYTTYTCACGDTYTDNEVPALDHIDENGDKLCDRDGCDYQFPGDDEPATPTTKTVTFNLGANGSASHNDGTEKGTYSETVDGVTLNISGGSKMYTGARDAKGNSCVKLGTGSVVGGFTINVPDNVTSVTIHIAKYKANTTKININGTAYTLTKNSNDGAYDEIVIDTTTTKTISLTTVSGGYRAMVNTIAFVVEE